MYQQAVNVEIHVCNEFSLKYRRFAVITLSDLLLVLLQGRYVDNFKFKILSFS